MPDAMLLNDRYQLDAPLGTGGMSIVHRAKDLMLERNVAIKLLREDYSEDGTFRERFKQEARAAANLSHPNIVTVHDFGLDQKHLFIVMEYIPGTDLKTLIRQKTFFSVEETLNLMIQACAGVGYAHRAGLVHCDIKPHNMLVTPDMRLKVTDFGIARALSTIPAEEHNDVVWGSPHYFSPEQAAGLAPSPASDVYSLGIILYEMLTGQLPFTASEPTELARLHREGQPIPPSRLNPSIPRPLEEIILKVLSKEPSARYRTADQLGHLLLSLSEAETLNGISSRYKTGPYKISPPKPIDGAIYNHVPEHQNYVEQGEYQILSDVEKSDIEEPVIDWLTWLLGLAAFASLFGLIPFWLYVYLTLKP